MLKSHWLFVVALAITSLPALATAADSEGSVNLQSSGPIAFGPDGVLFVGDTKAATIYAIQTGEKSGNPEKQSYELKSIDKKVAAALGTKPDGILINDLAVNPKSGVAYLSVSRGRGPSAEVVLLRVASDGEISEVSLESISHSQAKLPNPVSAEARDRRRRSLRAESITDIAYHDGRVLVAGLSNEEFASTLRSIPYPFQDINGGTSVEVFHGAHGRFETRSPVRTFATYDIKDEPHVLAGYTCTPLVKFSLSDLEPGKKVRGVTVAELGNRNRPLDMIVYQKDGKDFILMANSSRGMMKISTAGLERDAGIEERIQGLAGQEYETIEALAKVMQLDRLNATQALVINQTEGGGFDLQSVELP